MPIFTKLLQTAHSTLTGLVRAPAAGMGWQASCLAGLLIGASPHGQVVDCGALQTSGSAEDWCFKKISWD